MAARAATLIRSAEAPCPSQLCTVIGAPHQPGGVSCPVPTPAMTATSSASARASGVTRLAGFGGGGSVPTGSARSIGIGSGARARAPPPPSFSVSVSVSVSGGVSETEDETFRFARYLLTRSVELSDLYCLSFQLCGAYPLSLRSIKPTSSSRSRPLERWSKRALSNRLRVSKGGMSPSFSAAMPRSDTHSRNSRSLRPATFGCRSASV